jgi:LPXTG-site transpeptidase (sortase) family protein
MSAVRLWFTVLLEWLLVGIGIGCLGFYAYETVEARRFQAEQAVEFTRAAQAYAPVAVRSGGLLGMLDVPRLKLTAPVLEGDDEATLKRAAGHLPDTALPWEKGNSAIAGHRDGLFRPLKDIRIGDEIRFRSSRQEFWYRVTDTSIVKPDDVSVLEPRGAASLTLITCYPFYYVGDAPNRFIVRAERLLPDGSERRRDGHDR